MKVLYPHMNKITSVELGKVLNVKEMDIPTFPTKRQRTTRVTHLRLVEM